MSALLLRYPPTAYYVEERHGREIYCAMCGSDVEWSDCYAGCEDGYFDGYEEDPLWYDYGELVPCHGCNGRGGSYWCPNKECDFHEIRRIVSQSRFTTV